MKEEEVFHQGKKQMQIPKVQDLFPHGGSGQKSGFLQAGKIFST